jgi:hypothetical protein
VFFVQASSLRRTTMPSHRGIGREAHSQKEFLMQRNSLPAGSVELRLLPGLVMLFVALHAGDSFAGRDAGQMLAQDKANKEVIARRAAASDAATASSNEVLPLDHGPRATTTPWLNRQRRLKAQAAASAARDAKSADTGIDVH